MEVTRVVYHKKNIKNVDGIVCDCSVTLDNCLVLNNIFIISRDDEKSIQFPFFIRSEKSENPIVSALNENPNECFHPVKREFYEYLKKTIINGYDIALQSSKVVVRLIMD